MGKYYISTYLFATNYIDHKQYLIFRNFSLTLVEISKPCIISLTQIMFNCTAKIITDFHVLVVKLTKDCRGKLPEWPYYKIGRIHKYVHAL